MVRRLTAVAARNRAAIAVGLIVALTSSGTALAASVVLGGINMSPNLTTFKSARNGAVLQVTNTNATRGATPKGIGITVPDGRPPITVNATAGKAPNLDADKLDGVDGSAFLHAGGFAVNTAPESVNVSVALGSVWGHPVPVRSLTLTVPGAGNLPAPQHLVHLQGRVTLYSGMGPASGCPCEFAAYIADATGGTYGPIQSQTFESSSDLSFKRSFVVEADFDTQPMTRTFTLMVWLAYRADSMSAATFTLGWESSLSAMSFALAAGGATALSANGTSTQPPTTQVERNR